MVHFVSHQFRLSHSAVKLWHPVFIVSHIHSQEGKSQELGNVCITHFMDNYLFEMLIRLLRKISISSFQNYTEIEKTTYSERFIYV